jgi:hypothetical protein
MAIDKINIFEEEETFSPMEDELELSPEELQDLYQSIGIEQAELLIQEFKELKRSGFRGGFREFLQLKIKTAQGPGRPEEMMSEEEMQIDPSGREMIDIQQQIGAPTTGAQAAAYGGRMGYTNGGIGSLASAPHPDEGWLGLWEKYERDVPSSVRTLQQFKDWFHSQNYDEDFYARGGRVRYQRGGRVALANGGSDIGWGEPDYMGTPDYFPPSGREENWRDKFTGTYDAADDQSFPWQKVFAWLKERGEAITPENIQKAILILSRLGSPIAGAAQGIKGIGSLMAPGEGGVEEVITEEEIIPEAGRQGPQPRVTAGIETVPQSILPQQKPYSQEAVDYWNFANRPQQWRPTQLAKYGGRIGFKDGGTYEFLLNNTEHLDPDIQDDIFEAYESKDRPKLFQLLQVHLGLGNLYAQGGRIGYEEGGPTDQELYEIYKNNRISHGDKPMPFESWKIFKIDVGLPELGSLDEKAQGGRIGYGLGSFVSGLVGGVKDVGKSIVKSIKKVAKTDIGKLAMMYVAGSYLAGAGTGQRFLQRMAPKQFMTNLGLGVGAGGGAGVGAGTGIGVSSTGVPIAGGSPLAVNTSLGGAGVGTGGLTYTAGVPQLGIPATTSGTLGGALGAGTGLGTAAASTSGYVPGEFLAALGTGAAEKAVPFYKDPWKMIPAAMLGSMQYAKQNPGESLESAMEGRDEDVAEWDRLFAAVKKDPASYSQFAKDITFPYPNYQRGGRVAAQEGGLMNLGGLEKDYRNDGGFVPLGKKEKADDVPARLSKNEFVMTAEAVRNAGDGDVDLGAERMQNVMKNLEGGGSLSEQSQGLEGAREMFEVSERLSEVV